MPARRSSLWVGLTLASALALPSVIEANPLSAAPAHASATSSPQQRLVRANAVLRRIAPRIARRRAARRASNQYAAVARRVGFGQRAVLRPSSVGEPLDPRLLDPRPEVSDAAKAEWTARVRANDGRAVIAPLGEIDPSKPLLILVPGIGMNPQDMSEAVKLAQAEHGGHQIVLAFSDEGDAVRNVAATIDDAVTDLMRYRAALGTARGIRVDRRVGVLGHSYGGRAALLTLAELERRGLVGDGPEQIISGGRYLDVDSAMHGLDVPWAIPMVSRLPGVPRAVELGAKLLMPLVTRVLTWRSHGAAPKGMARHALRSPLGALGLLNRTRSMDAVAHTALSYKWTVGHISVVHGPDDDKESRPVALGVRPAVNNWYSQELDTGDAGRLRAFLQRGSTPLHDRDSRAARRLVRRHPGVGRFFQWLDAVDPAPYFEARARGDASPSVPPDAFATRLAARSAARRNLGRFEAATNTIHEAALRSRDLGEFRAQFAQATGGELTLGDGELSALRDFLRSEDDAVMNRLDSSTHLGLTRRMGLQQIMRELRRDQGFVTHVAEMRYQALVRPDEASFLARWDGIIQKMVPTIEGQHTGAMRTDPTFLRAARSFFAR